MSKLSINVPRKPSKADKASLEKVLAQIVAAQKSILDGLENMEKDEPLVAATENKIAKQRVITSRGRAAELKDLEKSKKRGELHTNPSKLERLIKDLNSDIATFNDIEGSVSDDRSKHFATFVSNMQDEITGDLPTGVSPESIGLSKKISKFTKANSKTGWGDFDKNKIALITECKDLAAEEDRKCQIQRLNLDPELRKLKINRREKIINSALLKTTETAASVRTKLQTELDAQDKPSKAAWAGYLGLGAGGNYKLTQSGSFQSNKIHLTMSSDSWTAAADGAVSISGNSVDKIYSALLKTQGWKQLHATLEATKTAADYPHVFLFDGVLANDKRWPKLISDFGWNADDVGKAQAALQAELDKLEVSIKRRIKAAKDQDGRCV